MGTELKEKLYNQTEFDFGRCFASVIDLINTMKNEYIKQCNPIIAKELNIVLIKLNEIQIKTM